MATRKVSVGGMTDENRIDYAPDAISMDIPSVTTFYSADGDLINRMSIEDHFSVIEEEQRDLREDEGGDMDDLDMEDDILPLPELPDPHHPSFFEEMKVDGCSMWLVHWPFDWLIDWLVDWSFHWLIDRSIDWLIDYGFACFVRVPL